jgi:hypothetical protein
MPLKGLNLVVYAFCKNNKAASSSSLFSDYYTETKHNQLRASSSKWAFNWVKTYIIHYTGISHFPTTAIPILHTSLQCQKGDSSGEICMKKQNDR